MVTFTYVVCARSLIVGLTKELETYPNFSNADTAAKLYNKANEDSSIIYFVAERMNSERTGSV